MRMEVLIPRIILTAFFFSTLLACIQNTCLYSPFLYDTTIGGNYLYFVDRRGDAYCISTEGELKWKIKLQNSDFEFAKLATFGNKVYISTNRNVFILDNNGQVDKVYSIAKYNFDSAPYILPLLHGFILWEGKK